MTLISKQQQQQQQQQHKGIPSITSTSIGQYRRLGSSEHVLAHCTVVTPLIIIININLTTILTPHSLSLGHSLGPHEAYLLTVHKGTPHVNLFTKLCNNGICCILLSSSLANGYGTSRFLHNFCGQI